jgi:hypothetical protein
MRRVRTLRGEKVTTCPAAVSDEGPRVAETDRSPSKVMRTERIVGRTLR